LIEIKDARSCRPLNSPCQENAGLKTPAEGLAAREALRCLIEVGLTDKWANYDIDGKRVPSDSERAVFRAKEVSVDTGVPAMRAHASLTGVEYRDVHAIDQPDLRKTFQSFPQMQRWFTEHAWAAKVSTNRSDAMRRLLEAGLKRRPKP
jgi:hypothetical protein